MSKNYILYALTFLCFQPYLFTKLPIKAICFDIETLFETDDMKASTYVGKINSLLYLKKVNHLPCQADLFTQLAKVPAQSTIFTYNNGLKMPLIFSDWLMNVQPSSSLLDKVMNFLDHSKLSDIEQTVLGNIVTMMFTATSLVSTQKTIKTTEQLLGNLKQKGYTLYLTGNWAQLDTLQQSFGKTLQIFSGIFVSGKMHLLKPTQEFYNTVLQKINFDAAEILWIEKESIFATTAKQYNLNIITFTPKQLKKVEQDLKSFGIVL